ncbi:hypothetical protein PoB_005749700 [Plakobranchus ocellatus]|uniref:Fibronectin type-III domain-containing protein n=1 Tax=Plakobranchus ocellatus TaxID=259542 RepID=A0AAV4CI50_9GAST|nr:hypothetical protein PoB_005749700 [Plakobranchus ocellatus]
MSNESRRHYPLPPEPIDERGSHLEGGNTPRDVKPPPPRLDSMTFPTNRLPQLDVPIIKRLPDVGESVGADHHDPGSNHNIDPSLPLPVVPEKTMFNLWEKTQTQTEVRWSRPENAGNFSSICYEVQIKSGEGGEWTSLTENYQPLYRVYFAEGKALFGRTRLSQDTTTTVVSLRVRPVGVINNQGHQEKKLGPWSENIVFSLEAKRQERDNG